MDILVGYAASLSVMFTVKGVPAIPTANSVFYTVYDHAGVTIPSLTNVAITTSPTQTSAFISLNASDLTITAPRLFEKRLVVVRYTVGGNSYNQTFALRIIPFLNSTVTPADVRNWIGLNNSELPDADIDIMSAYLAVSDDIGSSTFLTALSSGTTDEKKANRAILLKAAIDLLPSLQQRMAQSQTNGILSFTRASGIDFQKLMAAARGEYTGLIDNLSTRIFTSPSLVVLTSPTDAITG